MVLRVINGNEMISEFLMLYVKFILLLSNNVTLLTLDGRRVSCIAMMSEWRGRKALPRMWALEKKTHGLKCNVIIFICIIRRQFFSICVCGIYKTVKIDYIFYSNEISKQVNYFVRRCYSYKDRLHQPQQTFQFNNKQTTQISYTSSPQSPHHSPSTPPYPPSNSETTTSWSQYCPQSTPHTPSPLARSSPPLSPSHLVAPSRPLYSVSLPSYWQTTYSPLSITYSSTAPSWYQYRIGLLYPWSVTARLCMWTPLWVMVMWIKDVAQCRYDWLWSLSCQATRIGLWWCPRRRLRSAWRKRSVWYRGGFLFRGNVWTILLS